MKKPFYVKIYMNGEAEELRTQRGEYTFGEVISFEKYKDKRMEDITRYKYFVKPVEIELNNVRKVIELRNCKFLDPPKLFFRHILK